MRNKKAVNHFMQVHYFPYSEYEGKSWVSTFSFFIPHV
jgi:hypothetical protein